jgi:hypothetical protein
MLIVKGSRMDREVTEKWQTEVGYYLHPPRYPHSPGHPALEVIIRPEPTHQHYDPETLELNVKEFDPAQGVVVRKLAVFHPWQGMNQYRGVPGRIIISDRRDKKLEAFCFGSNLTIENDENLTRCTIQSEAPLLEMFDLASLPALLATEVEVMLAELRGRSIEDLEGFQSRLATVDPFQLYRSCLIELRERLADFDHQTLDPCAELRNFILGEIEALKQQGKWTGRQPSLDSLLLPSSPSQQA